MKTIISILLLFLVVCHCYSLFVEGKCKPDTIIREVRIPVEKVKLIKGNSKADFPGKLLWALAAVVVLTIIFKIRRC